MPTLHPIERCHRWSRKNRCDNLSHRISRTVLGAARMLTQDGAPAPDELRRRVTSPNGTTHAAIQAFEAGGLRALVVGAVHAARVRGAELSAANE
jgi:pyrroline-5-carboxylate reductase